jgi:hypothetical protein
MRIGRQIAAALGGMVIAGGIAFGASFALASGAQAAPCAGEKNGAGPGTCLVTTEEETSGPSGNPNAHNWTDQTQTSYRGNGSSQGTDQVESSSTTTLNPGNHAPPGQNR